MGKKLVPGRTVIKVVDTDTGKQYIRSTIYYGNHTMPMVDGRFKSLKNSVYRQYLAEFLQSEEGKTYDTPTEEEMQEATIAVANMQREYIATLKAKEEKETKEPEYIEPKFARVSNPEPEYEYEDDPEDDTALEETKGKEVSKVELDALTQMYRRQANILIIAVIFLTVVVALQMLLNLYLLTR